MGNSRVSYTEGSNGNAQVVEENSYYAFGLQHKGYGPTPTGLGNAHAEKYKYNSKELNEELGINWYDYGARNYDAAIGRWMNVDPLAEVSRRWSPYTYCYNNPVYFVDPDGMRAEAGQSGIYYDWNRQEYVDSADGSASSFDAAIGDHENDKGKGKGVIEKLRGWADSAGRWFDKNVGSKARNVTDSASKWASEYSESFESIGAGDIWSRHMEPAKELYELGFGPTGAGLVSARSFATKTIKSFEELAENPSAIWGKSADEVAKILGDNWEKQPLKSGKGWKFLQKKGDGFVSFTTGNSHHPNSTYYKISSGSLGKIKIVGRGYKATANDKSKIIQVIKQ